MLLNKIFYTGILFGFIQLLNAQNFNTYFEPKALRIDVTVFGNHNTTVAGVAQLKEEPLYGGSKKNLIFPNFGNFRIQLIDVVNGSLLYSKGFNSLYEEWQATELAKENMREFYFTFQVPFPKIPVNFVLQKRNQNHEFETLLTKKIEPDNYFILKEKIVAYPVKQLLSNGDSAHKVDLVIIPEGYTTSEMEKFYADAERMINYMFTIPPFSKHKDKFNINAIGAASLESGTDIPGKHVYKNTLLNSTFYTFDTERYLTTTDMKTVSDIAANVPYDQIYVLVNTPKYGGGGFYNFINLTSVDNDLSAKVFVHEFGHGFVGLADEYYTSETAFDSFYDLKAEPWEPNITTLVNFDQKWKNMLSKSVPIPTPRTQEYENTVGIFEGGGYVSKGIYSPAQDCRMKSNIPDGFCPVCSRAIEKIIAFYCE